MKSAHVAAAILLACLGTPATGGAQDIAGAQDISVQLLFDGQPLQSTAMPAFSCFDELRRTLDRYEKASAEKADDQPVEPVEPVVPR
jgi:hypothetical protein